MSHTHTHTLSHTKQKNQQTATTVSPQQPSWELLIAWVQRWFSRPLWKSVVTANSLTYKYQLDEGAACDLWLPLSDRWAAGQQKDCVKDTDKGGGDDGADRSYGDGLLGVSQVTWSVGPSHDACTPTTGRGLIINMVFTQIFLFSKQSSDQWPPLKLLVLVKIDKPWCECVCVKTVTQTTSDMNTMYMLVVLSDSSLQRLRQQLSQLVRMQQFVCVCFCWGGGVRDFFTKGYWSLRQTFLYTGQNYQ